jgi:hypothetical protein
MPFPIRQSFRALEVRIRTRLLTLNHLTLLELYLTCLTDSHVESDCRSHLTSCPSCSRTFQLFYLYTSTWLFTKVGPLARGQGLWYHIGTSLVAVTTSRGKLARHFTDGLYRTNVLDAFRRGHVIAQLDADRSWIVLSRDIDGRLHFLMRGSTPLFGF